MQSHNEMKKEKVANMLDGLLGRNQDYAIEVCLISTISDFIVGRFYIMSGRNYDRERDGKYNISWNKGTNSLTIPYDEVINAYEDTDEFGSQSVDVIMKCGMTITFGCCGERLATNFMNGGM